MSLSAVLLSFAIGAVSGVLSGAFGIGGGIVTTPAIRLLLGAPALVAVGTPLPVIVPGAVTGALAYLRRGLVDVRASVTIAAVGSLAAVAGAAASAAAGGAIVMLATAALMLYVAADVLSWAARSGTAPERVRERPGPPSVPELAAVGVAAGLYSGFLGLGGGFVIVPLLARWLGYGLKRAIGTSLLAVAMLAIPGSVAHYALGHVDLSIAAGLVLGVVPGAAAGARLTTVASETAVRYAFAILLACAAAWLAVGELARL
ncbi:MAG: sulfite exporter TauE/SafE family protein [Coriobacteriia bacterium]|nr:sulfite exporter TauE/SafE family protein [Coriobacteriia bacterium]